MFIGNDYLACLPQSLFFCNNAKSNGKKPFWLFVEGTQRDANFRVGLQKYIPAPLYKGGCHSKWATILAFVWIICFRFRFLVALWRLVWLLLLRSWWSALQEAAEVLWCVEFRFLQQ